MRYLFTLLLAVPTLVAAAESATCPFGEPTPWDHELSRDELSAVLDDKPGADIVLREAAAFQKAMRQPPASDAEMQRARQVTWVQARRLVVLGLITKLQTLHNGSVYLRSRGGRLYVTHPPDGKALWKLVWTVDPCHLFINAWSE
jgi:hypothetical protein